MKIYPSKHIVTTVDRVDLNDEIPLAYLDSGFNEEISKFYISENFNYYDKKEVLPYTIFKSQDNKYPEITLYNRNDVALTLEEQSSVLNRQLNSNDYMYIPKALMTFEPYNFVYRVLAKKDMKYISSRLFNIKATCVESETAEKLMHYFSDSNYRGLCPNNIIFNNGDKKLESLLNGDFRGSDFVFIESEDGESYSNGEKINIDEFIANNVIPFIFTPKIPQSEYIHEFEDIGEGEGNIEDDPLQFELKNTEVMEVKAFMSDKYFIYPDAKDGIIFHDIFKHNIGRSPIVIKEYENKGFMVYCHSDILKFLNDRSDLFYEEIMYLYLRAYISTNKITEWITDVMPDYIVQNGRLIKKDKFTSHMELHKLLGLYEDDVFPVMVDIEVPNGREEPIVYYTGMSSNYLVFKKKYDAEYADPIKGVNQISIFTEKRNVMYYDDFIYTISENVEDKLSYKIVDKTLNIEIKPFKNSNLDIRNFKNTINISYKLQDVDKQSFYLLWDKNLKTIIIGDKYEDRKIPIANIEITKSKKETKLCDMRIRGGGLSEDAKDNFDCLDIANILGKPYRVGGTMVVNVDLPYTYKEKEQAIKEIIEETLNTHMITGDYLLLELNFK